MNLFSARIYKWIVSVFVLSIIMLFLSSCSETDKPLIKAEKINLTLAITTPESVKEEMIWDSIINQYMDINPKVLIHIEYLPADNSTWRSNISTTLATATAPDIFQTRYTWSQVDFRNLLLTDLTHYYDEPNPYHEGEDWRDSFKHNIISKLRDSTNGVISGVSLYKYDSRVYYNKDLFDSLGIDVPKNWSEFIEIQEKIQDHKITPMAIGNARTSDSQFLWVVNHLINQYASEEISHMDLNKDNHINMNEIVGAIAQGNIDMENEEWNGFMPHIKKWSEYWVDDYNAIDSEGALNLFFNGETAMVMADSSQFKKLSDSESTRYQSFPLPVFDKGRDRLMNIDSGELDGVFSIPNNVQGKQLETAVDFLMYLSSPGPTHQLVNKMGRIPTTIHESSIKTSHTDKGIVMNLFGPEVDIKLYESLIEVGRLYLDNTISLKKYMIELNRVLEEISTRKMAENNWNERNGYGVRNNQ
ncbi:ABC transporter substrate-binding protein [Radiobacillus sp. PE A8.2]|uniref:ABC transporter substrate-binding protein n=1 Tax=Radiobacillus sp. PE A8.2 TaxID=3380349 RepID=UPI0038902F9A